MIFFLFYQQIVSVVLENYQHHEKTSESLDHEQPGPQNMWVQGVMKDEGHVSPLPDARMRIPSWSKIVNDKGELNVPM